MTQNLSNSKQIRFTAFEFGFNVKQSEAVVLTLSSVSSQSRLKSPTRFGRLLQWSNSASSSFSFPSSFPLLPLICSIDLNQSQVFVHGNHVTVNNRTGNFFLLSHLVSISGRPFWFHLWPIKKEKKEAGHDDGKGDNEETERERSTRKSVNSPFELSLSDHESGKGWLRAKKEKDENKEKRLLVFVI